MRRTRYSIYIHTLHPRIKASDPTKDEAQSPHRHSQAHPRLDVQGRTSSATSRSRGEHNCPTMPAKRRTSAEPKSSQSKQNEPGMKFLPTLWPRQLVVRGCTTVWYRVMYSNQVSPPILTLPLSEKVSETSACETLSISWQPVQNNT